MKVVIPGVPVAWARARLGTRGVPFTPPKQRSWAALAQVWMLQALGARPLLEGPLAVAVTAYWPRPASVPKRLGTAARWRPSRPDADNLGKQVCDAAIGVLYADDAQVVELVVRKFVAAAGEGPRVEVEVLEVGEVRS